MFTLEMSFTVDFIVSSPISLRNYHNRHVAIIKQLDLQLQL